jgi:hypothetical protein
VSNTSRRDRRERRNRNSVITQVPQPATSFASPLTSAAPTPSAPSAPVVPLPSANVEVAFAPLPPVAPEGPASVLPSPASSSGPPTPGAANGVSSPPRTPADAETRKSMPPLTVDELVVHGEKALAERDVLEAMRCFERAFAQAPDNPTTQSRLGLLLALERGQIRRGLELCNRATAACGNADAWLCLARVELRAGDKQRALQSARSGLQKDADHRGLGRLLEELGIRRAPVFSFLRRSHPINRYLGMLRHKLLGPPQAKQPPQSLPPHELSSSSSVPSSAE